jgi:hypothetical protein
LARGKQVLVIGLPCFGLKSMKWKHLASGPGARETAITVSEFQGLMPCQRASDKRGHPWTTQHGFAPTSRAVSSSIRAMIGLAPYDLGHIPQPDIIVVADCG